MPSEPLVMYQRWHQLLFLHAPVEPKTLQAVITNGLTVDTFPDQNGLEQAWVSLALFTMSGIRPRFLPAVSGLSAFHEINFRTYVHVDGDRPGVYFMSLDAGNSIACMIAKTLFGLKYHNAQIELTPIEGDGDSSEYQIENFALREPALPGPTVKYDLLRKSGTGVEAKVAAEVISRPQTAEPGSLEFFLLERYRYYGECHDRLTTGRVFHAPYQFCEVGKFSCEENLSVSNHVPIEKYVCGHFVHDVESQFFMPQLAKAPVR